MISVIIIAKNEQRFITNAIKSAKQISSDIVIIDGNSTDQTTQIAKDLNCKIITYDDPSFSNMRDRGIKETTCEWIFYLDADERITKQLAQELIEISNSHESNAGYLVNRQDYYFGEARPISSPMYRFFQKAKLKGWQGVLHESPEIEGKYGETKNHLVHFTHTNLTDMLATTNKWSDKEAKLRLDSNHPPVVWWRLIRVFLTGFYDSYVNQEGYKCGTAGWIEAIYQGCSMFITYGKLWELQNKQKIDQAYQDLDKPYA